MNLLIFRSVFKFQGGRSHELPVAIAIDGVKALRGSLNGQAPVTIIELRDGRSFVASDPPFEDLVAQVERAEKRDAASTEKENETCDCYPKAN